MNLEWCDVMDNVMEYILSVCGKPGNLLFWIKKSKSVYKIRITEVPNANIHLKAVKK